MLPRNNLIGIKALLAVMIISLLYGCNSKSVSVKFKIENLAKSDRVLYRPVGTILVGMDEPRGLCAFLNGFVVVGDQQIIFYTSRGLSGKPLALKGEPRCVVPYNNSGLFVGCGRFVSLVEGNNVTDWPSFGPKTLITSLAVTKDALWVADAGNRRVLKCSFDGKKIEEMGKKDADYPGLVIPSPHLDLAALPNGDVLWTNPGAHRVELHGPDGKMKSSWGKSSMDPGGFSGCCNPTDIAVLPDGSVVTSEKGYPRISVYKEDAFVGFVSPAEDRSDKSVGIDLAVMGERIFALDPFAKNVTVYELKEVAR